MKDSYMLYKDKLKGEYKEVFEQVALYMNSGNYDDFSVEDRLSSLMDMLLSAQERGESPKKIVGKDIQKFCKMFCSDMGAKSRILKIMDTIKRIAIIELIFAVFELLQANWDDAGFMEAMTSVTVSGYLIYMGVCVIFGFVADIVVRSMLFKRRSSIRKIKAFRIIIGVLTFVSAFLLLGYMPLVDCPLWLVFAVCLAYLVFYYIYNRKRLSENKREKVKFADVVKGGTLNDIEKLQKERYDILNKRNIKKGRGTLSMEEFLDMEEKDCIKIEKTKWVYYVSPLVITTVWAFNTTFEDIFSILLFIAINLAVQYYGMVFSWNITKGIWEEKRKWISNKRAELSGDKIAEEEQE